MISHWFLSVLITIGNIRYTGQIILYHQKIILKYIFKRKCYITYFTLNIQITSKHRESLGDPMFLNLFALPTTTATLTLFTAPFPKPWISSSFSCLNSTTFVGLGSIQTCSARSYIWFYVVLAHKMLHIFRLSRQCSMSLEVLFLCTTLMLLATFQALSLWLRTSRPMYILLKRPFHWLWLRVCSLLDMITLFFSLFDLLLVISGTPWTILPASQSQKVSVYT